MVLLKLLFLTFFPGQLMAGFRRVTGFDYRPLVMRYVRHNKDLEYVASKYIQANEQMLEKMCQVIKNRGRGIEPPSSAPPPPS